MYENLFDASLDIKNALVDLLDGLDPDDISFFTGLSPERSKQIYNIYLAVETLT